MNWIWMQQQNDRAKCEQTVFGTLSQVFFKRNTAALVNAAHTWSTPLKLCRQRHISATAVHFSMAATRDCILLREIISDETSREPSLKRFVICEMCSACDFLFDFIHACPKNSLQHNIMNINVWMWKPTHILFNHLLAANTNEYLMIQISHLFSDFQSRQRFDTFLTRRLNHQFAIHLYYGLESHCVRNFMESYYLPWAASTICPNAFDCFRCHRGTTDEAVATLLDARWAIDLGCM